MEQLQIPELQCRAPVLFEKTELNNQVQTMTLSDTIKYKAEHENARIISGKMFLWVNGLTVEEGDAQVLLKNGNKTWSVPVAKKDWHVFWRNIENISAKHNKKMRNQTKIKKNKGTPIAYRPVNTLRSPVKQKLPPSPVRLRSPFHPAENRQSRSISSPQANVRKRPTYFSPTRNSPQLQLRSPLTPLTSGKSPKRKARRTANVPQGLPDFDDDDEFKTSALKAVSVPTTFDNLNMADSRDEPSKEKIDLSDSDDDTSFRFNRKIRKQRKSIALLDDDSDTEDISGIHDEKEPIGPRQQKLNFSVNADVKSPPGILRDVKVKVAGLRHPKMTFAVADEDQKASTPKEDPLQPKLNFTVKTSYLDKLSTSSKRVQDTDMFSQALMKHSGNARLEGLANLGNTCYLNAVVQALLSLKTVTELLSTTRWILRLGVKSEISIEQLKKLSACEFYACFIETLTTVSERKNGVANLALLKSVIGKRSAVFAGNSQQDAHELLLNIVNELHDDMVALTESERKKAGEKDKLELPTQQRTLQSFFNKENEATTGGKTGDRSLNMLYPMNQLFLAQVNAKLECSNCHYHRQQTETYRAFSLDLPTKAATPPAPPVCECKLPAALKSSKKPNQNYGRKFYTCATRKCHFFHWWSPPTTTTAWDLKQLLLQNFQSHQVELKCEKCRSGKTAMATYALKNYPQVLTLHLKRFQINSTGTAFTKRGDPVDIPNTIVPADWGNFANSSVKSRPTYHLRSIIHHVGESASQGHYVTDVRNSSSKETWTRYDDSLVRELEEGTSGHRGYAREMAYILFYVQKLFED